MESRAEANRRLAEAQAVNAAAEDLEPLEPAGLTALDIKALRTADDVCAYLTDGEFYLVAIKRKRFDDPDPWADDKRHRVEAEGWTKRYREDSSSDGTAPVSSCYANVWHSEGIWQILRPGDRIRLCWSAGGMSSENLRNAGFVGDSLTIEVIRKTDTNGRRPLRFLGATYTGPDNTARLCR